MKFEGDFGVSIRSGITYFFKQFLCVRARVIQNDFSSSLFLAAHITFAVILFFAMPKKKDKNSSQNVRQLFAITLSNVKKCSKFNQ